MTIQNVVTTVERHGDGSNTEFSFDPVRLPAEAGDLKVTLVDGDTETVLTNGVDYTVAVTKYPGTGTVTFLRSTPLASTEVLRFDLDLDYTQTLSLGVQDAFNPKAVERSLDYLTQLAKQSEGRGSSGGSDSSGGSAAVPGYRAAPTLTTPTPVTTDMAIANTGDGVIFTLLDRVTFPGGINPSLDFFTEWEGFLILELDSAASAGVVLRTKHYFGTGGSKELTHEREYRADTAAGRRLTIPLGVFDSISRATPGTHSGVNIVAGDLNLTSDITYEIEIRSYNRKTNARTANTLAYAAFQDIGTLSYQIGSGSSLPESTGVTQDEVDASIAAAVTALRNGVAANMDTLAELAAAIAAIVPGATWQAPSPNAPTGGSDGDWAVRTGATMPGIYFRTSGTWVRVFSNESSGGTGGSTVLGGTRLPTSSDGSDTDWWVAGLDNGSTLSIAENVEGAWVEVGRASYDKVEVDALQHLTRDLHVRKILADWSDVADSDADLFWATPINGAITLTDANFNNQGTSITIPSSTSARTTYVFVRVPAATDVSGMRVAQGGTTLTSNHWALAADEGVTVPDNDTFKYFMTFINPQETAEIAVKLQERGTIETSRYDGSLGGEALIQAQNEDRFAGLDHLTRDLHVNTNNPDWENATDDLIDLYGVYTSDVTTLTDANFNGNGADILIASDAATTVFVRLPVAANYLRYRVVFPNGVARAGNAWTSVTGPDETTYQYWSAGSVDHPGGSITKAEFHEVELEDTIYTGSGSVPTAGATGQVLGKRTGDSYDLEWRDSVTIVDSLPDTIPDTGTALILRDPVGDRDEGVYVVKSHGGDYYEGAVVNSIDSVIAVQANLDNNPNGSVSEIEWTLNGLHLYMEFHNSAFVSDPPANLYIEITHLDTAGGAIGAADALSSGDRNNSRVTLARQADYDRLGHYSYGNKLSGATMTLWGGVDVGERLRFKVYTDSSFSTPLVNAGGKYYDLITEDKFPRQMALARLAQGDATDGQTLTWDGDNDVWTPTDVATGGGDGGTDATARGAAAMAAMAAAAAQATADAALPKAGGTMTGKIVLDGAPTANLHPATKAYADTISRVALAALPLTGGTLTGALTLHGAPTTDLGAATKKYVDDNAGSGGDGGGGISVSPTTLYEDASAHTYDHDGFRTVTLNRAPAAGTVLQFNLKSAPRSLMANTIYMSSDAFLALEVPDTGATGYNANWPSPGNKTWVGVGPAAVDTTARITYTIGGNEWSHLTFLFVRRKSDTEMDILYTFDGVDRSAILKIEELPNGSSAEGGAGGAQGSIGLERIYNEANYVTGRALSSDHAITLDVVPNDNDLIFVQIDTVQSNDSWEPFTPFRWGDVPQSSGASAFNEGSSASSLYISRARGSSPSANQSHSTSLNRSSDSGSEAVLKLHSSATVSSSRYRVYRLTSTAAGVPDIPAADPEEEVKYDLVVGTDGAGTWEEDLSQNFAEFEDLPSVDDFNLGDIVGYDDALYKLVATNANTPNLYEATVGRDSIHLGSEHWRGVAGSQSPNGFTTDGGFSANPDNAIILIMASDSRHIRVAVKKSVFEHFKGSAFATTDKLHMTLALESGDSDIVDMAYYNAYQRETNYLIFQHQHASGNYNLYDEPAGNNMGATFRINSNSGNQFAHAAALRHWLLWPAKDPTATGREALNLAEANAARLDAIDTQVDGSAMPIHEQTYDDTTALLAPTLGNDGNLAVSETFNNIEPDDVLVVDWTKCEHLNHHSEHVVPGSTTDNGRMYFYPHNFNATEFDGEFIYAEDRAIQDNGAADTLNSWIVGSIQYSGTNLTFGLHLQQGGTRANRNLKPQAGFSLKLRIFRNTSPANATTDSVHAKLVELEARPKILRLTKTEFDAITTKDANTLYLVDASGTTANGDRGQRTIWFGAIRWE